MQKANYLQGKWRNIVFPLTALLVVAADQVSKAWIRSYPEGQSIFEAGIFRVVRVHNTGAAFGLFQGQSFILTIVAFVGVAVILFYAFFIYRRLPSLNSMLNRVALGLILGGTVGNLIDRLTSNLGGVTDFIGIGIWPAFNVADSAVVVGVILFAYSLLRLAFARERRTGRGVLAGPTGYGFRVEFAEPVSGPVTAGYACHFGLGQFVAAADG